MSDFGNKINEFFKYKFEDIFGTIAIFGFFASMACLIVDLIFGTEWAIVFLVSFFAIFIASIFLALIAGLIIYDIYVLCIAWWSED
ncbi:MAG: hypothetical protein ACTTH5_07045 [Wolinella sp.]